MAKTFGAKRLQLVGEVFIPSIMPYLLAGFRIGLSIAFIMVVVGEFFAATHGVGYMIAFEAGRYNTSAVMAWVLIISAMTILFTEVIRFFERKRW
jgi:NitT/TauT family transport system permease protein